MHKKLIWLIVATLFMACNADKATVEADAQTDALYRLLDGNQRFVHQQAKHPDESMGRVHEIASSQHPFAVVVCCSDSRVAPEIVFDQGLGDLFVVRTAGNMLSGIEIGSIEYAVTHLQASLVFVMGHENCGAVKAFIEGGDIPGHIKEIVDSIGREDEVRKIALNDAHRLEHVVNANALHACRQLIRQSPLLQNVFAENKLTVVAGVYGLQNGKVTLLGMEDEKMDYPLTQTNRVAHK
jgi:carbonic anhydrase